MEAVSAFEHQAKERIRILAELQSLSAETDAAVRHGRADDLLIEYLRLIGADDLAKAWELTTGCLARAEFVALTESADEDAA